MSLAKMFDKQHLFSSTSHSLSSRCATESKCDILTISSSPNYSQNFKEYSGTGHWPEFEMPGDTVYYKFTSDASNTDWGWKFTVTGGQLGRYVKRFIETLLGFDLEMLE